jgi:hypothetical protein
MCGACNFNTRTGTLRSCDAGVGSAPPSVASATVPDAYGAHLEWGEQKEGKKGGMREQEERREKKGGIRGSNASMRSPDAGVDSAPPSAVGAAMRGVCVLSMRARRTSGDHLESASTTDL